MIVFFTHQPHHIQTLVSTIPCLEVPTLVRARIPFSVRAICRAPNLRVLRLAQAHLLLLLETVPLLVVNSLQPPLASLLRLDSANPILLLVLNLQLSALSQLLLALAPPHRLLLPFLEASLLQPPHLLLWRLQPRHLALALLDPLLSLVPVCLARNLPLQLKQSRPSLLEQRLQIMLLA